VQAQSAELKAAAEQDVNIRSRNRIEAAAQDHVTLAAGGAYIKISGGSIEIHAPGKVAFRATMKDLSGPAIMLPDLPELPSSKPGPHAKEFKLFTLDGKGMEGAKIAVYDRRTKTRLSEHAAAANGETALETIAHHAEYSALAGYQEWTSLFEGIEPDIPESESDSDSSCGASDEDGREEEKLCS
jgi:type VI secretion system secreted protein VgrG